MQTCIVLLKCILNYWNETWYVGSLYENKDWVNWVMPCHWKIFCFLCMEFQRLFLRIDLLRTGGDCFRYLQ